MTNEAIVEAGALALYRAENSHRVQELEKRDDAQQAIAADFEMYKSRYVRKFSDVADELALAGLAVTRAA